MRPMLGLVLLLLPAGHIKAQTAPAVTDSMAVISWLAGDWQALSQEPGSSKPPTKVVSHYRAALGGKFMSVEMSFDALEFYRGMFGYDPLKKSVVLWYLSASGQSSTGTVGLVDGDTLFDFTIASVDGKTQHFQARLQRMDPDHFRWALYGDSAGTGKVKLSELIYSRVK